MWWLLSRQRRPPQPLSPLLSYQQYHISLPLWLFFCQAKANRLQCYFIWTAAATCPNISFVQSPRPKRFDTIFSTKTTIVKLVPFFKFRRTSTTNIDAGRNGYRIINGNINRNFNTVPVGIVPPPPQQQQIRGPEPDDVSPIPLWSANLNTADTNNHSLHRELTSAINVSNHLPFSSSTSSPQRLLPDEHSQQQLTRMTVQFLQHGIVSATNSTHDPSMMDQQIGAMTQNLLERWIQYYYSNNKITTASKSQYHSNDISLRFITILFQRWFHRYAYRQREEDQQQQPHHIHYRNSSREMMHYLYRILYLLQQESKQQYEQNNHKKSHHWPNSNAGSSNKYIQRSYQLLQTFYTYSMNHREPHFHPKPKAYSMVLEALSYYSVNMGDDDQRRYTGEVSTSMSDVKDRPNLTADTTWDTTTTIVGMADELMKQLHELYDNHHRHRDHPQFTQHPTNNIIPYDIRVAQNSYLRLLARYCKRRQPSHPTIDETTMMGHDHPPTTPNLAEKAEEYLWNHMITPQQQPMARSLLLITPDMKSYSAVLQAYVNQNAPDRACHALNRMVHHGIIPDLVCYNICLQSLGNAGHATEAHHLLLQMIQLSKGDKNIGDGISNALLRQPPDVYSYLAVIKAYATCCDVTNVIHVFEQMIQNDIVPNTVICTTVLDVLAQQPNSGPLVEEMLQYLERLHYGDTIIHGHESNVTTANATAFMKPCREAYTIAVRAWGKTTTDVNAPDRATNIFRRMQRLSVLQLDDVKGKSSDVSAGSYSDHLSPCTITYTSLIHAWAQSCRTDAPSRALQILRFMEEQPQVGAIPDTITYNAVLNALARHGLATEAHQLLNEMIGRMMQNMDDKEKSTLFPNAISWATVIQAYRKKGSNAGMKANDLLLELEQLYDTTGIQSLQPTADIYSVAILAQVSGDQVDVAEQLFWRMLDRYRPTSTATRRHNNPPTTSVCNALLRFWSHSRDPVAPQRAERILHWMEEQSTTIPLAKRADGAPLCLPVVPNDDSYQYVLRTWYRSKRRNAHLYIQTIQRKMQQRQSTLQHLN